MRGGDALRSARDRLGEGARSLGPIASVLAAPFVGALLGLGALGPGSTAAAGSTTQQSIAVPAYFSPGPFWTQLDRAHATVRLAVVDPDNGPGPARQAGYASAIDAAKAAGITVVGYVFTDFAHRPLDAVETDIEDYHRWYGLTGVFFDQASTNCADEPYYAALDRFVKNRSATATTILNPGSATSRCYARTADILLTFEGPASEYLHAYRAPAWVASYPPSHFWQVIYATTSASAEAQVIELSRRRRAGFVYVTEAGLPNQYDALPSGAYWTSELADVAS